MLPATISGPTRGAIGKSTARESSGIGHAADSDGYGSEAAGFGHGSEDVRRSSAGGDSDEHVLRGEGAGGEVADTDGRIVLGGFGGAAEGGFAAGHDALYHLRWRAEGGWDLRCIQHAEPAAGTGAEVEEAASIFESRDNGVYGARDGGDLAFDGSRHTVVLGVDDAQGLLRGQGIDGSGGRIRLLGE